MHQVWPYNVGKEINAWTELNVANSSVQLLFCMVTRNSIVFILFLANLGQIYFYL